ncbi:SpoIIE family protein phosphatase [Streptomyces sp. MI02-7b]|uniref:ATP-binding SpoIIE family protein phosphatase n=1 Tax=Streptomyces sp. MI02-7b TaxID=462941 RepID=UPI0029A3C1C0|nr:SpoIIE family protein phosphatase [Streptomyces sp. MI02-7b]MDX3077891.1 SpoIIE family protein phosphatase [Streptomyces sp. MI02-7b]
MGNVCSIFHAGNPVAFISVDPDGSVDGWSEEAEALLGYDRAEIIGRPALGLLVGGQDQAAVAELVARGGGRSTLRHKRGHFIEADVLLQPSFAAGKSTVWVMSRPPGNAVCHNLLEESWAQSSDGMILWSLGLQLLWANDRTCQQFGTDVTHIRGRLLTEIISPEHQHHAVEQAMRQVRDTGTAQSIRTYEQVQGEYRPHEWVIRIDPVRDQHGTVVALCTMARDNSAEFWARQRLVLLDKARRTIGHSLNVERTACEFGDLSVPDLADVALVHLLPATLGNDRASSGGPIEMRLVATNGDTPDRSRTEGSVADSAIPVWRTVDRHSLPGRALREGRAVRVDLPHKAATWPEQNPSPECRRGGGAICAPLTVRGTTLGVVTLLRHELPFDKNDLLLVEELAETTAVCIDNARHYEREHSTSLTLQQSLLPREPPAQNAVDAAYGYRPADRAAGVGGDWFDVIPLSGTRVALVVGDVVGHGVQAAATMGRLRSVVRTLADVDLSPEELLACLDDIVIQLDQEAGDNRTEPEVGASVLYAVYDPVSHRCRLARAAHVAPVLVLPDGTSDLLDLPEGPPLGVGGLPFESAELVLPEGSLLVLFTDGVVESRDRDLDAGIARLQECLGHAGRSPAAVCDDILTTAPSGPGGDDAALLVARTRVLDPSNVAQWEVPADASAVAGIRDRTAEKLRFWGLEDKMFATELIVSELVTNALRYGRAPIQLRLIKDKALICEVTDGSNAAPHMRRARTFDEGGRGLFLVAQMSSRWGSRHLVEGKIIWAEQQLEPVG